MNNDDTRPADTSGHTAQSEQSEAAAAITRSEFEPEWKPSWLSIKRLWSR